MNDKRKMSVSGLQNIGALLSKADVPAVVTTKTGKEAIVEKTIAAMGTSHHWTPEGVRRYVGAAVREAYNLGHADALTQNEIVESLLQQQYESRTLLTMPTVIASVMEQLGMTDLMLDLNSVVTVFKRCRIEFEAHQPTGGDVITYKLSHLADVVP